MAAAQGAISVRLELLGRMPDTDHEGRYRDTACHYSTIDIADPIVNLASLIQKLETKSRQFSYRDFPRSILDDCEAALRCDPRPIDRYLDNYLSYTNFAELEHRRSGIHGLNRVVVNATVTSKDNLSVRLWMKILDDRGRWISAPEWREIPLYGMAGIMERPSDEVLFIRNVDRLMIDRIALYANYERGDPNRQKLADAACELINATFWLTVQRLAQRFEVTLSRYLVLLREKRDGRILGLDIVDALDEHRREIARGVADFEAQTGWTPEDFWAVCESPTSQGGHYASDSVVKRLRAKGTGTVKLTPGEVRRRLEFLAMAENYGFWKPARGGSSEKVVSLFQPTPPAPRAETQAPNPLPAIEEQPKASPTLVPHLPRNRELPQGPNEPRPTSRQSRSQFDPPSYTGLRSAPWTEELRREFAVQSTDEFVAFLNALRRAEKRLPVPQGSFPSKASDLEKLVKEARLARARQQPRTDERTD